MSIFKGIFPALISPFNENNDLDTQMLKHHVLFQIQSGVHGLIIGGSLGEASTLSMNEKSTLTIETKSVSKHHNIPVIVNIAESTTKNALHAVQQAEKDGANGLMVLPPMRYLADFNEMVSYFLTIADSTELPIMIYNNPVDYNLEVSIEMFEKLLSRKNIQAVKESTRNTSNIIRLRKCFGSRLKILCGVDTLAFESLVLGADGWVAGLVNAFPVETVRLYDLIKSGQHEEARKINSWFFPLLELDITSKLVQNIKLAASSVGLSSPYVRLPRKPLEGEELKAVTKIITTSLQTRPQL